MSVTQLAGAYVVLKNFLGVDEKFLAELDSIFDRYGFDLYSALATIINLISLIYLLVNVASLASTLVKKK